MVGLAHCAQLPQGCLSGWHPHSLSFDTVKNGCSAVGASTRMGQETMQADMGADSERYNPILDAKKDVNKDAAGLDCVHEMNTINHYVGMFPIATGAPVEKPMAKFFFGFFAVMLLGFITPEGKRRVMVLTAGFCAVAAWMVVHQLVLGNLASHVKHYMDEAATFFNEPARIKVWGDNVTLFTPNRHGRADRRHGAGRYRCRPQPQIFIDAGTGAQSFAAVFCD
jgi:hypothetical protein